MAWMDFKKNPEKELWLWATGAVLCLLALLGTLTILYWLDQRGAVDALSGTLQSKLFLFVIVLAIPPVVVVVVLLRMFFSRYVLPLHRLGEDLEALLHGAPGTRIRAAKDSKLSYLEAGLNELVERHNATEEEIEQRLKEALRAQLREQQELESVMDALSEGVIVCDPGGNVLHYNRAAKRLLDSGNQLGIGRSVHNIVEEPLFNYAQEAVGALANDDGASPSVRFVLEREGEQEHLLRMTILQGDAEAPEGYILTCEDPAGVTAPMQMGRESALGEIDGSGEAKVSPDSAGTLLEDLRYVVFDTETTGLRPREGDEIISIGAVAIAQGRILYGETFEQLVDPECELKPSSIRIHGITAEALRGKPTIGAVLPRFSEFSHDSVLVAHNAAFDMGFLKIKEPATGIHFDQPVLDTLLLSSIVHPTQTSHALDTLLTRYGIKDSGRHTAMGDALMTAELFLKLLPQLKTRGITTLAMALEASRRSPLARFKF